MAEKKIADIKDGVVYILQPGTPVYIRTADVSAMTGRTRQRIEQLVSDGALIRTPTSHGSMFNLRDTMKSYLSSIEDRIEEQTEDDKKIERKRKKSEAILKASKATIASLEAQERSGKMHRSEDVAAMTEDMVYAIRSSLLALPGRLAVDVVSAKDTAEASEIIRKEIYSVMEELSQYRYDPKKYEERVRERLNMDAITANEED